MIKFRHVCIALGLAIAACASAQLQIRRLIIFGDSLSDTGNLSSLTGGLYPGAHYYNGRFSNGPVWVERLAADLGIVIPAPSRLGGTDYAYGGATTANGYSNLIIPNMGTQLNMYLSVHTPAPTDLFILLGGANDLFNGSTDPTGSVSNIMNEVGRLYNAGARKFLVANLPALGETPRNYGTSDEASANAWSAGFDGLLDSQLASFHQAHPNARVYPLDLATEFANVIADPGAYGFTDVRHSAFDGTNVVSDPDDYLFWDTVHPTRVGHIQIGDYAALALPFPRHAPPSLGG
ncbi:MAG TPA: SGNH/GDSL hydrolase family protein [Fimbriimonadaceae bacterium]|nr:SGNH/GDSL hydrolase family protein [Fimbriimonadaceae bacterium]